MVLLLEVEEGVELQIQVEVEAVEDHPYQVVGEGEEDPLQVEEGEVGRNLLGVLEVQRGYTFQCQGEGVVVCPALHHHY